jgi:hypothetical protein
VALIAGLAVLYFTVVLPAMHDSLDARQAHMDCLGGVLDACK